MTWIIEWSLRNRPAVIALVLAGAAAGGWAISNLPLDAFPDVTPVQVQVNTVAPSLGTVELERQVTAPIERALGGLPGTANLRSLSRFGFSQVTVVFAGGTDIHRARQAISERLAGVDLPDGVEPPRLGPIATGLGEVFHYLVRSAGRDLAGLRSWHDMEARPRLQAVPGVAEVNTWGGMEAQVHVAVDPDRLIRHGLCLNDVVEALRRNNRNAGGGLVVAAGEATVVRGVAQAASAEDIGRIALTGVDRGPVLVRDVADVAEESELRLGAVTEGGRGEAVLGLGFSLMGENSREVARGLRERLDAVRSDAPPDVAIDVAYDRTDLVDRVLRTVRGNLLEGALLVVAVLFAFLGSLRAGLIVASAIPLSLLFAGSGMLQAGIAGSLMSLGAIDFGLIVDSSVVIVENAVRRTGEDGGRRPAIDVVRDAALEVRRPTMFGELIIMVVYLPILTLEGVEGSLFRPMALTVVFALAASLVLSLTWMPVLCSLLLPRRLTPRHEALTRAMLWLYRPVLRAALRFRFIVIALAVALGAAAAWIASGLGAEFVPRLHEGTVVVNAVRLASVSLDESVRYGTLLERALLDAFPDEIERVWTRTGSPEIATDPMGVEVSDIFVTLRPRERWRRARTHEELVGAMAALLERFPGMRAAFTQPIEMRINEMTTSGARADVAVKVYGDDIEALRARAEEVRRIVSGAAGAADVTVDQATGQPMLDVEVDREALALRGLDAEDVLEAVEAVGTGLKVGEIRPGMRRIGVAVRIAAPYRSDPEAVGRIPVATDGGAPVLLREVAALRVVEAPASIQREWGRRRIMVQANVRGRDVGGFVAELRRRIADELPRVEGAWIEFGGQFEHLESARKRLLVVVPGALLLVIVLLYATYGRVSDALRVFLGAPFAAVGGIAALWLRDMPFSISAGVGFVVLSGVSVLGDMVLVSRVRQMLDAGMPLMEAVREAAQTRLRPVLMTGLVASLGFLPMALAVGVGAEVQRPLATVVVGGVLSTTLLTLVVQPALYAALGWRGGGTK